MRRRGWCAQRGIRCLLLAAALVGATPMLTVPAHSATVLPTTAAHLEGEADHWVLGGRTIDAVGSQVEIFSESTFQVTFEVTVGESTHYVTFQAADADGLRVGSFAAGGPGQPVVDVAGDGAGCTGGAGGSRLDILDASFDQLGHVQRFAARFEFHCSGNAPALFGTLNYRSRVDFRPHNVAPPMLEFDDQPQGKTSTAQKVVLTNTGATALTVSGVGLTSGHVDDFAVTERCTAAPLLPAQTCDIDVTYRPTLIDEAEARLTIFDDTQPAGSTGRDIVLRGSAIGPEGSIDAISFASEAGQTPLDGARRSVKNPGGDVRMVSDTASVTVYSDGYSVTISDLYDQDLSTGTYTGPGLGVSSGPGRVGLSIGLAGRGCGTGSDGVLVIDDLHRGRAGQITAVSARFAVRCAGDGDPRLFGAVSYRSLAPYRTRSIEPTRADFGTVDIGQSSASRSFVVTNEGPSALHVTSVVLAGAHQDDFVVTSNTCNGVTLSALQWCTTDVAFRPTAEGPRSAELRVVDDVAMGESGGHRVPLTGTGRQPEEEGDGGSAGAGSGGGGGGSSTAPQPLPRSDANPSARSGYWMVDEGGTVYAFGDARSYGNAAVGAVPAVDVEPTPSGAGYWIADAAGRVFAFGDAVYLGGFGGPLRTGETVTSISATPTGRGYWLFTTLGRVVSFGDARHHGDMSSTRLNGPVLDSVPTPSGGGYYLVASDGGIFTFGDAVFGGSLGATRLNAPVQSLVPDADGVGYWLVASDGGIFAFDAPFHGSTGDMRLNRPITGMVAFGSAGYLMVAEDGGIFTFGSAAFHGSLGSRPPSRPIVAAAVLDASP